MKLKFLLAFASVVLFALPNFAQQDNGGIKQDTKDAAHSTGNAAKKTGHDVKHGTKKVVHKGAQATKKGAGKVEGKTETTPTPPR